MTRFLLLGACAVLTACGGTTTTFNSSEPVNIVGLDPEAVMVSVDRTAFSVPNEPSLDINDDFDTLINGVRLDFGAGPLSFDARLGEAAQDYAELMLERNHFGHIGPDGSIFTERVAAVGYDYTTLRENIAGGQQNVTEVFEAWQGSEGHRNNNLATDVEDFGLGYAREGVDTRWVLLLGTER